MSTNRKNRGQPVLRNIIKSKYVDRRDLLLTPTKFERFNDKALREMVDAINDVIQRLNRKISTRNVRYMRIDHTEEVNHLDKARAFLRSEEVSHAYLMNIRENMEMCEENTFLVELFVNDYGYVEIGYASEDRVDNAGISNFLLIDREYLDCALIDIFLDSALFNSYSFLRALPYDKKRDFNRLKVDFLKERFGDFTELDSSFYDFNDVQYDYLSIAFFTRIGEDDIDLDELIELWDELIQKHFPTEVHTELPACDQLAALTDYEQYPKAIFEECRCNPKGAYWLLRIHKEPDPSQVSWLEAIFGQAKIGEVKVIPFDQLNAIYTLVRNQDITAFKFIAP